MSFLAERHSAFFRRSLEAWRQRGSVGQQSINRLTAGVAQPLTAQRIQSWVDDLARELSVPAGEPVTGQAVGQVLRRARALTLTTLIERDLCGAASLDEVCQAMTALAEIAARDALAIAADELSGRHGVPHDDQGRAQDLLVVGMGKAGGHELNVSSDLDLIFVFREEGQTTGRPDQDGTILESTRLATSEFMHRLARRTVNLLAELTGDGFVFRVDTRLRPNGESGPLVASLAMLEDYFFSQAREWERFAWLKARVIADSGLAGPANRAGDEEILRSIVRPFVFRRYLDFRAFAALRDLHSMIRSEVIKRDARHEGSFDVKLGRGGIREIEFIAQLFQIVRGGRDYGLRDRRTLVTLAMLGARGLLDEADVGLLSEAYTLLRRIEHALQYQEDAQTHRLPIDPPARARIAAMLRIEPDQFNADLSRMTNHVQRIFDDMLHGDAGGRSASGEPVELAIAGVAPALPAVNNQPPDGSEEEHARRLQLRIDALRSGSRYRAARSETREAIDRLIAGASARHPGEPGLIRLIDLLEAVSGRAGYVALLAQYPQALGRVLRMVAQAKWAADYLVRHPIVLDELLDGQLLEPVDFAAWAAQVEAMLVEASHNGAPDVERQMDILREAHHGQVFRLLAQDLEGQLTIEALSDNLSELADRVLDITIRLVWSQLRRRFRDPPQFAAIAYGRLGGKELGYASDLDLVFIYDDDDDRAIEAYALLAQRVSGWLSTRTAAGLLFEIDLRLRPNGNAGLLVSSLASFGEYQRKSAWVWEHQALTRARFAAGDRALGSRFEQVRREVLGRPRDPVKLREEVVAMRNKMLDGHPNRSELFDLKHDRGGMVDIEFMVQFLVLAHGHRLAQLLDDAGNIALLRRAGEAGLIDTGTASTVGDAYRRYRQLQHRMRLNDAQYARVEPASVQAERAAVLGLWRTLLG